MAETNHDKALLAAINAIAHLVEYIDTKEATDIHAAFSGMVHNEDLKGWLADNEILIPLRRDGRSLLERIEDYR